MMQTDAPRLIFVYNAGSGLITALIHTVHKQVHPASYPCSLCALTFGLIAMRREWKHFVERLPGETIFHHRDDFSATYPALGTRGAREVPLPAILVSEAGEEPRVLISKEELDAMAGVGELMDKLTEALASRLTTR
jgi:hypothetical protein